MGDAHALPVGEHCGMVIALLAALGVDLIVIEVLLGAVLARRRGCATSLAPSRERSAS
jgi:hypothetical protein